MTKILSTTFVLLLLLSTQTYAQEQTISGKVTDADGKTALPGVNVLIKDTSIGTITDLDGNYNLQIPATDAVLVFSFIGYKTIETQVGNQSVINVSLKPDVSELDELVVIGFGEKRKKDLTGSIGVVGDQEISKITAASPQFALQGNVSGVRVANTSGNPNEAPQIFIRGVGTWVGDSQPLYVVDGQIIEPPRAGNEDLISGMGLANPPNLFNLINPNDIASITVLKDAASAAVYGSRGANGVILITTKKGELGAPTVEFNARAGIQNIPTYDMLNTQQFVNIAQEMYANNTNPDITIERDLYGREEIDDLTRLVAFSPQYDPESPYYISDRTTYDWQDELVMENALNQAYDVKVSGGTERVNYYVSGGYFQQEGMLYGNNLERFTGAINLDTDVTKWLKLGVNYKYANQVSQTGGNLQDYADNPPWQPLRDPSNQYGFAEVIAPYAFGDEWQAAKLYGRGTNPNYLALSELNYNQFTFDRHMGQLYAEISPLKGLTFRGSLSLDYTQQDRYGLDTYSRTNIFEPTSIDPAQEAPSAPNSLGGMEHRINNIYNFQTDFIATYHKVVADRHNFTLTGVVQDQRHQREVVNLSTENITLLNDDKPDKIGYSNDLDNNSSFYGWDQRFWFGIVGRLSYSFDNKYYLDASFRRDGSVGFNDDNQWDNFYALTGAWRVSEESFMENVAFINDLKIRGGWGEAGNDQSAVGQYAFLSRVNTGASSYRWGSGSGDPFGYYTGGALIDDFPNPVLTWEVVVTKYIGFDLTLLNNNVTVTAELFNKATQGIQQRVEFPHTVGTDNPLLNIGEMENRGLDLQLGYNNSFGDFQFGFSGNISFLENEVTNIYNDQPLTIEDINGNLLRVEEGRSVGHIWGYKVGGIFQDQDEIDQYYERLEDQTIGNKDYVGPGDMYFQNIGGNPTDAEPFYSTTPDSLINSYDQTVIGNTVPGYTYGFNLNAGWKGFDLYVSFYGEGDVDKYNFIKGRFESMSSAGENLFASTLDRWTPENPSATMPRAVAGDPAGNNRFSDRWVESAAFFRLNNWQFGYTLPSSVLGSLNNAIKSLRIYVGGQNNLYLFEWSGIDPVNDEYPLPRAYNAGLSVRF